MFNLKKEDMIRKKRFTIESDDEEDISEEVLDLRKSNNLSMEGRNRLCSWCGKRNLCSTNGILATSPSSTYCSDLCYEQFRRAAFKKRSSCLWCTNANNEEKLTIAIKQNTSLDETKFCSEFCLRQFKLKLFCEETTSHLQEIKEKGSNDNSSQCEFSNDLITPALWLKQDAVGKCHYKPSDAKYLHKCGTKKLEPQAFMEYHRHRSRNLSSVKQEQQSNPTKASLNIFSTKSVITTKRLQKLTLPLINVERKNSNYIRHKSQELNPEFRNELDEVENSILSNPPTVFQNTCANKDFSSVQVIPKVKDNISVIPFPFPFILPIFIPSPPKKVLLDPIDELE